MLGSKGKIKGKIIKFLFQNLIGMLGSRLQTSDLCMFFRVSKPYRYARKVTMIIPLFFFDVFQNLIGMLGRVVNYEITEEEIMFQNLIGMLGRQKKK